ncbi:MAG: ASCH domain-containing protein [Pseudomonadota bacterium]
MQLEDALARYPSAATFRFGDNERLMAEILRLVRTGKKTVTCDAVAAFSQRGDALPQVGRVDIALDWHGQPACAIRTVDVQQMPFDDVSENLVRDHGEFPDVAAWRKGYETELRRAGLFSPDVMMLVERFELIENFGTIDV